MTNYCRGLGYFFAIFLLILLVSPNAKALQVSEWKGKIANENGIRTIINPREPLFGTIFLDLEEDLRIGNENDDNYLFYIVSDIDIDVDGNIYVDDAKNYRIQKFDKNGKFVQTIGRKGEGPGEFTYPLQITVDTYSGQIIVIDHRVRQIEIFNKNGKYVNSFHPPHHIDEIYQIDNESYFVVFNKMVPDSLVRKHVLSKINSSGEIIASYAEHPYNVFRKRVKEGTLISKTYHELSIFIAKLNKNKIVYGYSRDYTLNVLDANGKMLYRIKKDAPVPKYTDEEKRENSKYPIPEPKPYFYGLIVDSEGRIYVQRNHCYGNIKVEVKNKIVDVFSKEGYYLFKTELPANTCVIRNDLVYCFERNEEEGTEYIKRYKIIDWDQLKQKMTR